ncbi:MAG: HNH endonuclease [Pirellulales bacterium]
MTDYRTIEQLREELKRRYAAADWSRVKLAVFKRDGFKCRTCGSTRRLRAHHKSYRHLWDELNHLDDLATQCANCHRQGTYGELTIAQDRKAIFWLDLANAVGRGLSLAFWAILRWTWRLLKALVFLIMLTLLLGVTILGLLFAILTKRPGLFRLGKHYTWKLVEYAFGL